MGESVGLLYSVNTLGSGVACFLAAVVLMRVMGETGSVRLAACFNLFVGTAALLLQAKTATQGSIEKPSASGIQQQTIPFWIGMLLAGVTGFIALAYEIVWYRLYTFASGGTAACFAKLLAFYSVGIAYGSFAVRDACRKKLGNDVKRTLGVSSTVVLLGAVAAYLLGPVLGLWVVHFNYELSYIFVFIAAALLGSAFPLFAHAAIDPAKDSGKSISLLYVSNIVGSTLGSFLVGFVILDHWSTRATSVLLLNGPGGCRSARMAGGRKGPEGVFLRGRGGLRCAGDWFRAGFSRIYERLLTKALYKRGHQFSDVVENRSGVIAVLPEIAGARPTNQHRL